MRVRILERWRPVDDDAADPGDGSAGCAGPADVLRDGRVFWSQCPVCPWEGDGRLLHIDAAIDAAQHNTAVHPASPAEGMTIAIP